MAIRPRIGILMDAGATDEKRPTYELSGDYVRAVVGAGGLPVLLPFVRDAGVREEWIGMVDGLIVPGGRDLNPARYGQAVHAKARLLNAEREDFDFAMLKLAEARGLPVLGICLGCQIMNVYRGGSLHQHVPEVERGGALEHSLVGNHSNTHGIAVRAGTKLAGILRLEAGESNSRHHQAIDRVGEGLRVTATATDGIVEGIEDPGKPFWMAVQWHPENLAGTVHERLFAALVAAAGEYRGFQR